MRWVGCSTPFGDIDGCTVLVESLHHVSGVLNAFRRAGVPDSWLSEPAQSDELGAFMVSGDR